MKRMIRVSLSCTIACLFAAGLGAAPQPPMPAASKAAMKPASQPASAPASQPAKEKKMPRVRLKTSLGDIVVELDAVKAPISTANFLQYVKEGYYDGTTFHRVIPTFMIQGGGYTPDFSQKPTHSPIKNEWQNGLKNVRGTIAMARTGDPDSATSQFFINVNDNRMLDVPRASRQFPPAAYAVFGAVVEGMDVVEKIKAVPTRPEPRIGGEPTPVTPVIIENARVVE